MELLMACIDSARAPMKRYSLTHTHLPAHKVELDLPWRLLVRAVAAEVAEAEVGVQHNVQGGLPCVVDAHAFHAFEGHAPRQLELVPRRRVVWLEGRGDEIGTGQDGLVGLGW